jgi:hypothetical protein
MGTATACEKTSRLDTSFKYRDASSRLVLGGKGLKEAKLRVDFSSSPLDTPSRGTSGCKNTSILFSKLLLQEPANPSREEVSSDVSEPPSIPRGHNGAVADRPLAAK